MTKNIYKGLVFAAFLIAAVFVSASSAQTVSGSISNGTVARGTTARGYVRLHIPAGLHVNSSRPSSEYAIPTKVTISASGVTLSEIIYPKGTDRKFQFSKVPINVYEGTVAFPFRVTVPKGFRGRTVTVRASVYYQACTDEVCYPPKTKTVTITARVR
jgi:DsbC/DsbD-like thiol-disulfide interchange protein